MNNYLVVVESPAKAKTIKKYLGKDFHVLASYGHVRDLLRKEAAVDPNHQFAMRYAVIEKNIKHVDAIVQQMQQADALYLATDPDREGEAIAWHLCELLREREVLEDKPVYRVEFHEITESAIKNAVQHPRQVLMDYVNAQQARRALDFLVGFKLSPLLWKKIRRGLSAGRVQSPALRMIVEREEEIEKFVPREYWTITADLKKQKQTFKARLIEFEKEKISQFSITDETTARRIESTLREKTKDKLTVLKVDKKQRQRHPAAPFITSTLQQEAIRKLGFTAQRTMRVAQQLYEGFEIDGAATGLITYMRTDSVNLAAEAIEDIRHVIAEKYGKENVPEAPRIYKTKSKNAQEAHEAIRPTSSARTPDAIRHALTPEQFKLYQLIWKRTIASQMTSALLNTVTVEFDAVAGRFRATGSVVEKPGFLSVYEEDTDDAKKEDTEEMRLPAMSVGDVIDLLALLPEQHFTEPPPRYTEASLVKALEEYGIGRPSTYASIISTLQNRDYVTLDQKRFKPTDVGRIVNRFLTQYFTQYVDYDFTARLEDELDAVSRGEKVWLNLLEGFWTPFKTQLDDINTRVERKDVTQEALDENCPKCQKPLSIRLGKRGRFIGCSGYPDCDYTRNLDDNSATPETTPTILDDRDCPKCQSKLQIRHGRYGKFIGCTNYPKCKYIESFEKPKDTGVTCAECHQGTLIERKSRYGKLFYACNRYPDCKYAVWNPPIAALCPKCRWPILTIKTTKRRGTEKVCPQKNCGYAVPTTPLDEKDPSS